MTIFKGQGHTYKQQSAMWLICTEITTGDLSTDTTEGELESYHPA